MPADATRSTAQTTENVVMDSIALLNDPAAFRTFEHDGWQAIADEYDDHFGKLTRQLAGSLLDAVGARWRSTVRMAGVLRAQPPEAPPALRAAFAAAAARHRDGHEMALPMPAILASAVKEPRG